MVANMRASIPAAHADVHFLTSGARLSALPGQSTRLARTRSRWRLWASRAAAASASRTGTGMVEGGAVMG